MVEGLAKFNLKTSGDHENFQTLYDAWKCCESDLKEIGRESCLQEQRAIKDMVMKMPKPIRERYLLQSAPEWQCLTELIEEQYTVSKAVARINKSEPKSNSSVV